MRGFVGFPPLVERFGSYMIAIRVRKRSVVALAADFFYLYPL